ncbi:MAG TPA: methyltransferase domain-containing protein [Streptosporangiaceae bacterium]|nr:methyltransferase domain-containing protein [Streptosporangiaceae bacterium]
MQDPSELLERWRADLASWAIPERILAAAAESPWVMPVQVFARRADRLAADPGGPSFERAWEALDPPGSVLDVGSGPGAACLPLIPRSTAVTAVDADQRMLDLLAERAAARGLRVRCVPGTWPQIASQVAAADVVTCHHVLYNVPDLEPFVTALTTHARRLVVVEVATTHPLTSLNPLWLRFHDLTRPDRPTADDVLAITAAIGLKVGHQVWGRPAGADYASFDELTDVTRRRLCLPADRAADVASALRELGVDPAHPIDLGSSGRDVMTIWWEGQAGEAESAGEAGDSGEAESAGEAGNSGDAKSAESGNSGGHFA